jgi:hypothetical protein
MMTLSAALSELRAVRRATVRTLAGMSPASVTRPAPWRGGEADVRHRLLRLADDDAMRVVRLQESLLDAGHAPTEAQRILASGCALRGRLAGSLVGLSTAQFDQGWGAGEWSVRRVLGHVIVTDRRYMLHCLHSVSRARAGGGPMRPADGVLPPGDGIAESKGTMEQVLERLSATRDEVLTELSQLSPADLEAETVWVTWTLDVRFRLHRFAEHDREHLVQLRKTYAAIGFVPTEPQRILEEAGAVRGALEGLLVGVVDGSRAAAVAAPIVEQAAAAEREAVGVILSSVA